MSEVDASVGAAGPVLSQPLSLVLHVVIPTDRTHCLLAHTNVSDLSLTEVRSSSHSP